MAYNIYFINKRKNSNNNQTNSSARILPLSEENKFPPQMLPSEIVIDEARRTGILMLSNYQLTEIPYEIYSINSADLRRIGYNGFDDKDNKAWWNDVLLTKLDLSLNKIRSLDTNIIMLSYLTHLDLHDNNIESLPEEIGEMQQLTYLNLSKNEIALLPESIGSLEQLQRFLIGNNKLRSLPRSFCRLLSLEVLDLSNNYFDFIPEIIGYFIRLKQFSVACNNIKVLPDTITKLKALIHFDVSQNRLATIPTTFEAKFEIFRCKTNSLTEFPIFKFSPSLKELYIDQNKISLFSSEHISFIPNITILMMSKNLIAEIPNDITQLQFLNHFDISYNSLSAIPYGLGSLELLQYLSIQGNPIRSVKRAAIVNGTYVLKRYLRNRNSDNNSQEKFYKNEFINDIEDDGTIQPDSFEIDAQELNSTGTVNLSNRGIKSIPEHCFVSLKRKHIKVVQLSYNKLSELPSGLFLFAQTVVALDISYNLLLELPDTFKNFKVLQQLNLSGNYLRYLPKTFVFLESCLLSLNMAHNPLGQHIPDIIFQLKSLQNLNLSNCSITSINATGFMNLPNLSNLDLSNNDIDTIPPLLGQCQQIKKLNLHGTKIDPSWLFIVEYNTEPLFEYLRSQIKELI